jgi:hypothetical protein
MRTFILAFFGGLALAASTQAAPVWRHMSGIEFGAAPLIELVRDGCGRGWHRSRWHDQWGYWHWDPLYSERRSPRCLERRLEPSLLRLARPFWGLG